jgi:hypothetical protein
MLPPFIIEQIRKREEEERKRYDQPQLELPVAPPQPKRRDEQGDEGQRGVIIVELQVGLRPSFSAAPKMSLPIF